jgi:hypothetical protein
MQFLRGGERLALPNVTIFTFAAEKATPVPVSVRGAAFLPPFGHCPRIADKHSRYGCLSTGNQSGPKEMPVSNIARRQFIQLSAVAAAGCFLRPGDRAEAQEMAQLSPEDPQAQSLKYTHDASTVDPASRPQPAAEQTCANCALIQGTEGEEWRPCQIFPGKLVNAKGWCSVWSPKA